MKKLFFAAALVTSALVAGSGVAENTVKSGPQVGQKVPGPFHPMNLTGAKAGEKNCLYCQNGTSPVAMIFAREVSPQLTRLIKKIDEATIQNKDARMGSFVVFLSDNEGLSEQLKTLASREGLKSCVLAVDNPAGPERYNISKDAEVTVVLYEDHTVRANHAYRKGQLNETAVNQVVTDVAKIVNAK